MEKLCPRCGGECERESADIGVGIIHGPYGCYECGWSEDFEYDLTNPDSDARTDQWGFLHPTRGHEFRRRGEAATWWYSRMTRALPVLYGGRS